LILAAFMVVGAGIIVFTIGGIAVPKMQRATRQVAEVNAVQQIQIIQMAQAQYFSQFQRYAASLVELGPPAGGRPGPSGADLIPADLASGVKGGYRFAVQGDPSGYRLQVLPIIYGKTGVRTFYTDQSGVIRQNVGPAPATGADQELQ
jgi:type IV pilus assembly protein PilA